MENIIQCAALSAHASIARKESRWGMWHFRSDYPERNDRDWRKHVVVSMGESPADVKLYARDITKMPESRP
jgi:succinate dehydrogenase/fumarate reductase flavoprotein subunit